MKPLVQGFAPPPPIGGPPGEGGAVSPTIWIELQADQQRWVVPLSDVDERPLVVGTGSRSDVRLGGRPVGFFHLEKRGDDAVLAPGYGGPLLLDSLPVVRATSIQGQVVIQLGDLQVQVHVHSAKPDPLGHVATSNSAPRPREGTPGEAVTSVHAYDQLPTAAFRAMDEAETVVRSIPLDETETLAQPFNPEFFPRETKGDSEEVAPPPPTESEDAECKVLSTEILGSLPDIFGDEEAQDLGEAPVLDPVSRGRRAGRAARGLAEIAPRPVGNTRAAAPRLRLRSVRLERVVHPEFPDGGSVHREKVAAPFPWRAPFQRLTRMVRERPGFAVSLLSAALLGLGAGYVPPKAVLGVGRASEEMSQSTREQEPDSALHVPRLPPTSVKVPDQSGDSALAPAADDEKRAVEHLIAGRHEEARVLYARLSRARPDREEFLTMTHLLERYLAPAVPGHDPDLRPLLLP